MICNKSQNIFSNTDDYFVHQFNTGCLSQFSYYIESKKEALVIDPIRDSDQYLDLLNSRGASLKYILETHFHADFVSGHCELARLTGAKIVFGPTAVSSFEAHIAKDEEILELGKVGIMVLHTPGHTMESVSYILLDTQCNQKAIFTGDFLFLGEVGRPDLAVSSTITEADLASCLYDSLQKIKILPDEVIVFPGHGAGSQCGKNISSGSSDSLGNQKKINYALNDGLTKDMFIEIVTSNLSTPPKYFFTNVDMNKNGHDNLEKVLEKSLKPIKPEEFVKMAETKNYVLLDSRDFNSSRTGFFKDSYLISLKITYAVWTATLLSREKQILLVTDVGQEKESIIRLARVGFENVVGYVEGGYNSLKEYCQETNRNDYITSLESVDLSNIKTIIEEYLPNGNFVIIDVREKSEWESTGVVPNSILISLKSLEDKLPELISISGSKPLAVFCKTGGRAAIAGSILKKNNITKKVYYLGGILNMIDKHVTLKSFKN